MLLAFGDSASHLFDVSTIPSRAHAVQTIPIYLHSQSAGKYLDCTVGRLGSALSVSVVSACLAQCLSMTSCVRTLSKFHGLQGDHDRWEISHRILSLSVLTGLLKLAESSPKMCSVKWFH